MKYSRGLNTKYQKILTEIKDNLSKWKTTKAEGIERIIRIYYTQIYDNLKKPVGRDHFQ